MDVLLGVVQLLTEIKLQIGCIPRELAIAEGRKAAAGLYVEGNKHEVFNADETILDSERGPHA